MRKPTPAHLQAMILKTCRNEAGEAELNSLNLDLIDNRMIDDTAIAKHLLSLEILDFSQQFTSLLSDLDKRRRGVITAILNIGQDEREPKEKRAHAFFYLAQVHGPGYFRRAGQLGHKKALSVIQTN